VANGPNIFQMLLVGGKGMFVLKSSQKLWFVACTLYTFAALVSRCGCPAAIFAANAAARFTGVFKRCRRSSRFLTYTSRESIFSNSR